ncbi:MAG TPA: SRPBCC domain-containing protein [Bryobacteraceae bacterium]|jgi:uncharacterized protein YndB with AHSA1/START domain
MVTTRSNPEVALTLPSDREIVLTCILRHPPELIYQAWTQPEHIRNWQGCAEGEVTSCAVDLREGGAWHYTMRMPDGSEHPFHGVYREIVPSRRLEYTSCYDMPAFGRPEWIATVVFEPFHNGTRLIHTILHETKHMRDGHLRSGMENGLAAGMGRLDDEAESIGRKS